MGPVTLTLLIVANVALGIGLGFWHRNLMIALYRICPDLWQRLGREDRTGRLWSLSLHLPIWSWGSLFFFIGKKYEKVADQGFVERAAVFRIALLVWLLELCVAGALNMYLGHLNAQ
jgi:hypothetical protein